MPLLPHHSPISMAQYDPIGQSEEKKLTILTNDSNYNHDETFPNSIDT
jgi:hypothetical protein